MGTKERRTREREETRAMILEAAREMFAEEGFEAVTMRAIAERIEYTPTAIYHHFANKQALLTELCLRDFSTLAAHFQGRPVPPDPIERIKEVGRAYLEFAERYPSQYRFMFMTVLPQPELPPGYVEEARGNPERDAYAYLCRCCQDAIDSGRLRSDIQSADQLAQILWACVHGQIALRATKPSIQEPLESHGNWVPWHDLRASTELMMDSLMRGLLRDPGARP